MRSTRQERSGHSSRQLFNKMACAIGKWRKMCFWKPGKKPAPEGRRRAPRSSMCDTSERTFKRRPKTECRFTVMVTRRSENCRLCERYEPSEGVRGVGPESAYRKVRRAEKIRTCAKVITSF